MTPQPTTDPFNRPRESGSRGVDDNDSYEGADRGFMSVSSLPGPSPRFC